MFEFLSDQERESEFKAQPDLRRLFFKHQKLDKKVEEAEHSVLPLSDEALKELKRERLHVKEEITRKWPDLAQKSIE